MNTSSLNRMTLPFTMVLLILLLLLDVAIVRADDNDNDNNEKVYTTKYDNVDIESVIKNERLLTGYVGCLLETKSCSPDAAELKRNLPDALATNCSRCSEAQKRISERLTHHLIDNKPDDWRLLEMRYDPSGAYRERYLSEGNANTEISVENDEQQQQQK